MTPEDVPSARALLSTYLERFSLAPEMTEEEFAHWLLPRPGVINSYVIRDERGNVTDMCSFYHLTSSVIKNDQHPKLYAVYSFYNVATTMPLKVLDAHPTLTNSSNLSLWPKVYVGVMVNLLW